MDICFAGYRIFGHTWSRICGRTWSNVDRYINESLSNWVNLGNFGPRLGAPVPYRL